MWHCSLCNLDIGEISAIGKENDHPTCPYCHGVVEEVGTRHPEEISIGEGARWTGPRCDIFAKASKQSVDRIFEFIAMSIEDSPYLEYKEDILQIIKDAFEPVSRLAQADIARIFMDTCNRADGESQKRISFQPLLSICGTIVQ